MKKIKTLKILLVIGLVAVFSVGAVGIGIFTSRIGNELQTSVIKSQKTKQKKIKRGASSFSKKLQRHLVAQALTDETQALETVSCAYIASETARFSGEFMSEKTIIRTDPDAEFTVSLYIKNTGDTPWFGDSSDCANAPMVRLGTARQRDRSSIFYNPGDPHWMSGGRIAMVEKRVEPGEIATFAFTSKAPDVSDIFREYFQPVVENVQWMESKAETATVDIYVGNPDPENERKLLYINWSDQTAKLDASGEISIDVNLSTQRALIRLGDTVIREYMVSSGAYNTPTPRGTFKILTKQELRIGNAYPHYRMPYFELFTPGGAGFHALPYLANDKGVFWNEALTHLGQRVSHGCIRMSDENAIDLYNLTVIGTPVSIHY